MVRSIRWPPQGLGLGAPFIGALLSGRDAVGFRRVAWQSSLAGVLTAAAMILIDQALFAGVSLARVRTLGAEPVWTRFVIIIYSSVAEEVIYRLGIMTLLAWLAARTLSRLRTVALSVSIWFGILSAAILFGLAHVGNLPNAPHPIARAVTINGFAGVVLGWLYWKKGFEAAIIAHFAANVSIYFGLASLL